MRATAAGWLAILGLIAACDGDGGGQSTPKGRWYAGDFHVHTSIGSNDTRYPDGVLRSFPDVIKETAIERGMSFLTITDHSNSAGSDVSTTVEDFLQWNQGPEFPLWQTAASLSSDEFLMIDGSEISPVSNLDAGICPDCPTLGTTRAEPRGHIGCIPEDLETFDLTGAFTDRPPGAITGGMSVEECRARNGFAIINHPFYRSTPHIDYDWTSQNYNAIEVWNGTLGYSSFDRPAFDAYLCDRLAGKQTVAVGGSDNHRITLPYDEPPDLNPPLGLPMTSVFAEELRWDAIMEAVRAGRIVIHDRSAFVDLTVEKGAGNVVARIGDRVSAGAGAVVLRGRAPSAQPLRLFRVGAGDCSENRVPGRDVPPRTTWHEVASATVCEAGACEFEISVPDAVGEPGLLFGVVGQFGENGLNLRDMAVTNVITVES